ncbi:MAG: DUF938 domain-containing protein [Pseudomonadota bacterium]
MKVGAEELAHTARNGVPILEVLKKEMAGAERVLEIGSGNGQHAVVFAAQLPQVTWQTSDLAINHESIRYWMNHAGSDNILPPLELDVAEHDVGPQTFDAVYSANTAHIMSIDAVKAMFSLVGCALEPAGIFCLYGPFRQNGRFNTDSNAAFDTSLRERDPAMGIRDLETLDEFGETAGLVRRRLYAMPANNHLAVWQK